MLINIYFLYMHVLFMTASVLPNNINVMAMELGQDVELAMAEIRSCASWDTMWLLIKQNYGLHYFPSKQFSPSFLPSLQSVFHIRTIRIFPYHSLLFLVFYLLPFSLSTLCSLWSYSRVSSPLARWTLLSHLACSLCWQQCPNIVHSSQTPAVSQ